MRWLELIVDYTQLNSPLRTSQIERIPAFAAPTWTKHFEQVDQLLMHLTLS